MSLYSPYCDCCGLRVEPGMGDDCQRCGYPVNHAKEEAFLRTSVYDLGRVAAWGGAHITVAQLIERYQRRLASLSQRTNEVFSPPQSTLSPQTLSFSGAPGAREAYPIARPTPSASAMRTGTTGVLEAEAIRSTQPSPPQPMFSPKIFFADQSINIVASLGAFLILIGTLSFIVTTSDMLFACLVLLIIHAFFGSVGAISYRFDNLRIVSIVYTAIFALQVPLVGFAVYRFVAGSSVQISIPLLIALASCYATLAYGVLSVYQRFKPFGYLAAAALVVTNLALAAALHLTLWWWSPVLLLLIFPLQLLLSRMSAKGPRVFSALDILREPVQVLLGTCVVVGAASALLTTLYSLSILAERSTLSELRFSLMSTMLLLALWLVVFTWQTKRYEFLRAAPYLSTACLLSICYAFYASRPVYVLALILLALLACALARLDLSGFGGHVQKIERHLETLALLIVGAMPFIAAPQVIPQLLAQVYIQRPFLLRSTLAEIALDIAVLLLGCLLTLSIVARRTGWRRTLTREEAGWSGLLLLAGFLLNYTFALVLVAFAIAPVWPLFGFLVLCVILTTYTLRSLGSIWARPLQVLVIAVFGEIMLLGLGMDARGSIVLLFSSAVLFYGVALYQWQRIMLLLALLCALLALPHLFISAPPTLLSLALLLPLAYAGIRLILADRLVVAIPTTPLSQRRWTWDWPLLLVGTIYGLSVAGYDSGHSVGILQDWLVLPVPQALELALVGLAWYGAGMLTRQRWLVAAATGLALWCILLILQNTACSLSTYGGMRSLACMQSKEHTLYWLAAIALFGAVLGVLLDGIMQRVGSAASMSSSRHRIWSWPWYLVSLQAMVALLIWSLDFSAASAPTNLPVILCGLALLVTIVMLIKRTPELLLLATILAGRAIMSTPWPLWQQMIAYSVLCILIFAAQFLWHVLTPTPRRIKPARLSLVLATGGQTLVVIVALASGGLSASTGMLVHTGVGSLVVLALLLLWKGCLQTEHTARWSFLYGAGLLCTLVVPWELFAFTQASLSTLWLVPASYFIVISPFLTRDERLAGHQRIGQFSAIVGALLLLLPTLWLSFSEQNLQPSLLLAGESLFLLLLGVIMHRRFFVLSSTGFIVIVALHVLFLPSLGIPTFLALSLTGLVLLVVATLLVVARSRLAALWTNME